MKSFMEWLCAAFTRLLSETPTGAHDEHYNVCPSCLKKPATHTDPGGAPGSVCEDCFRE